MEMRTEEILCAGLHAGPVQVLRHQNRKASINNTGLAQRAPPLQLPKSRKLGKALLDLTETGQDKKELLQMQKVLGTERVFRVQVADFLNQVSTGKPHPTANTLRASAIS